MPCLIQNVGKGCFVVLFFFCVVVVIFIKTYPKCSRVRKLLV